MKITSSQANKLLVKLNDELNTLLQKETATCRFNAAVGEDIESVRPEYDYMETRKQIYEINRKIRRVKHALNIFNSTTVVPGLEMTIDEVLIYLPQLTKEKERLNRLRRYLPKERVNGMNFHNILDYVYTNYDVRKAEEGYLEVSELLTKAQNALDVVNNTVEFELNI